MGSSQVNILKILQQNHIKRRRPRWTWMQHAEEDRSRHFYSLRCESNYDVSLSLSLSLCHRYTHARKPLECRRFVPWIRNIFKAKQQTAVNLTIVIIICIYNALRSQVKYSTPWKGSFLLLCDNFTLQNSCFSIVLCAFSNLAHNAFSKCLHMCEP